MNAAIELYVGFGNSSNFFLFTLLHYIKDEGFTDFGSFGEFLIFFTL